MARVTQPYKHSFTNSIGSGLGSLFGGSGKQYYILEHKISSKYHKAGEEQQIIVDRIEIGRDAKCQVRFDESFTTVSRRHAAIIREGDKWKLIQLSTTNPTFLNGAPVKKEWYLQNGDEIQLAVGGPKLGYIIPGGNRSTVGTIGLSRRLSLFRHQALRPYKQAITILSIVLCLLLLGSAGWGFYSYQKQRKLLAENTRIGNDLDALNKKAESLALEADQSKEEIEAFRKQAETLADELIQNNEQSSAYQKELAKLQKQLSAVHSRVVSNTTGEGSKSQDQANEKANEKANDDKNVASVSSINTYFPYVFAITMDKMEITVNGQKPKVIPVQLPSVIGSGFLLNDGRFITARHVLEPWFFYDVIQDDAALVDLNLIASNGGSVVCYFTAISSSGKRFSFNSNLAKINRSTDKIESLKRNNTNYVVRKAVIGDTNWAVYQSLEKAGFQFNNALSIHLETGVELETLGFTYGSGAESIQISPVYSKCNVARQGLNVNGTIMVFNENTDRGNAGGAVLINNNGDYQVIGMMSGSTVAKGQIVPVSAIQ